MKLISAAEAKKYQRPKTYTWQDIVHPAGVAAVTRSDVTEQIFYAESDCLLMNIFIRIGPTEADELFEWDVWVTGQSPAGESGAIMLAYFDFHQHFQVAASANDAKMMSKTSEWFEKMGPLCILLEKGDSIYGLSQYFNGQGAAVTADDHGSAVMIQIAEKD